MVYIKLVLTMLFWGGTFIAGRIAAQGIGPLSGAAGRFAVASIILLAVLRLRARRWPMLTRREALLVVALAATGVVAYNLAFFLGLREINAGRAALIIALNPAFITLAAASVFRERVPGAGWIGIFVSLAGAVLVITRGDLRGIGAAYGPGEAFITVCVAMWVSYTLIGRVALQTLSPLVSTAYASALGCAGLLLPAALFERGDWTMPSTRTVAALVYLGVFGTVLGFIWYYDAVRELGPSRAGIFINLVPVFAVVLGNLLLDEALLPVTLLGGMLVVAGVTLTSTAREKNPPETIEANRARSKVR